MAIRYGRFEDQATIEESDRRLQANRTEALERREPPKPKPKSKPRRRTAPRRTISLKGLTYERLRAYAKAQGTSLSSMVERWIDEALGDD